MKRVLIVTTVSGFVPQFEMNNVRILQEMGYEVHYASNFKNPHYGKDNRRLEGTGIVCHQVDFVRSPFQIGKNVHAYRQLKKCLKQEKFDLIHCHTPMGSVLGRLAAQSNRRLIQRVHRKDKQTERRSLPNVMYTAHGFHFFNGAPLINWLVYYPVERWLAHYTDALITINEEDYQRAKKFHLRTNTGEDKKVYKVNGVGINLEAYQKISLDNHKKRQELEVGADDFLLLSVGELSKRKNHQIVIRALASMKEDCIRHKVRYLICGEGPERGKLLSLIKENGLEEIVFLMGYQTEVKEILAVSDCFVFPSKQEGLPVALLEALAVGVPCICSRIRGNLDLKKEGNIDFINKKSVEQCKEAILKAVNLKKRKKTETVISQYETRQVVKSMRIIYRQVEEKNG